MISRQLIELHSMCNTSSKYHCHVGYSDIFNISWGQNSLTIEELFLRSETKWMKANCWHNRKCKCFPFFFLSLHKLKERKRKKQEQSDWHVNWQPDFAWQCDLLHVYFYNDWATTANRLFAFIFFSVELEIQ